MAVELILPRVDMDMSEGKIAHWYVKNGDTVTKGQVVFEIETDKATMEIDAAADGIVQGIDGQVGVTMPVGQIVGWILQPGEAIPAAGAAPDAPQAVVEAPAPVAAAAPEVSTASRQSLLRATPLARSLARERGIDLNKVSGSGPEGRVLAADMAGAQRAASQASTGALNLHWFSRHEGAPLVLLHGFGTSQGSWRVLADQLRDLPVLGIDLPNHGKSPRAEVPNFAAAAQAVLDRLDSEGINEVHLLGHSMGGGTALALTALLGSRLRSLTLLAPAGLGPEINGAFIDGILRANSEASLRPWLVQLFGDASRLSGSFVATALQELGNETKRAGLAAMAASLLPDGTQAESLRKQLDGLVIPVKLLWGTLDRVLPIHQAAGLPGHVALHTLAGTGHLPQIEAAPMVAGLVRQQVGASAFASSSLQAT
ncbi:pyruvate dehydrogenase E2 component (dihydrolipoamide acetyltransferase) [Polaromonas sp. YR568]|uniref:acetoin dehydrogenase dihydrolipoyllysine-residue acetyltransferase subunit n=1 Tax=Polaromonas sp. YR568 TaxID=1855301 RepID=UPI0008F03F74|nr:acetoin dehydrogenase dihydrolipoyllysine-residue acetyltransferase subunit [Polaromonas sp. YR568]SFU60014.1 pyruvate dehydrogenase E2 component (dihydrolipoamide acetyltransferase) [Polaromonas sp. YR568]